MSGSCPACGNALRTEQGKMNVQLQACPADHGVFVDASRLRQLVDESTALRIRSLSQRGGAGNDCPACGSSMRQIDLGGLRTDACASCGGLWFVGQDLAQYQREWRNRAYGEHSFVSRGDVLHEAQKFYAAEVISGVLAEFEMSLEEEQL